MSTANKKRESTRQASAGKMKYSDTKNCKKIACLPIKINIYILLKMLKLSEKYCLNNGLCLFCLANEHLQF